MSDESIAPQAPEPPSGPDWSAFEQAGITPDNIGDVQNALNLARGLQNLDTRHQYLQQIVRPDIDGNFLRQVVQPPEEHDPWQALEPQYGYEQPEQQYEQPVFDPRSLQPVFEGYGEQLRNQIRQEIMGELQGMAQEQAVKDASARAAQQANIPAEFAEMVEFRVKSAQQMYPNRQVDDLAREVADQLHRSIAQYQASPPANQAPSGSVPAGPIPDTLQRPRSMEEAMEYSRQVLNP